MEEGGLKWAQGHRVIITIIGDRERVVQRLEHTIDNGAMVSSILPMLINK